jgi:N-acetylglucosamine kinase-like BadF-type ATPase
VTTKLFMGIDGGASKTAGLLVSASGTWLAQCRLGGSAIVGNPSAEAAGVLAAVADELCRQAGVGRQDLTHLGIGLNGMDFPDEFAGQHEAVAAAFALPQPRVTLVNDGVVALWGATPAAHVALIQIGSGLTAILRAGMGHEALYDTLNVGNLLDINAQCLALVARMIDGRAARTGLADDVLRHVGLADGSRFAEALYRHRIAYPTLRRVSDAVFTAWDRGDAAADGLVRAAADDYALLAKVMVERIGEPATEVVFGGGVMAHTPLAFKTLLGARVRQHCPRVRIGEPKLPPHAGACIMAMHHAGLDAGGCFASVLENRIAESAGEGRACEPLPRGTTV